jgi:V8-like Glu-specific endopeptidase
VVQLFEEGQQAQAQLAAERFLARTPERVENVQALAKPGGIASVNTAAEVARRLDRVTRYLAGEQLPTSAGRVPAAAPADVIDTALERAVESTDTAVGPVAQVAKDAAEAVTTSESGAVGDLGGAADEERAGVVLEKIIGTADFVGIRYLEGGVAASRAVCRIVIRDRSGRTVGYGTGSLVSPRLLLTNHHVLESMDVARLSAAEFNYQDGVDGQPLQSQLLTFDPDAFFLADPERDFALVAISAGERAVGVYGFNRLIEAQGKAIKGDYVTIVQHPHGEKKQVALRENKIVDEVELFLHYSADTEPGSSGSPVFNDQWEIVALHHASVAARQPGEYGDYLNEGVRASRILDFVHGQPHTAETQSLVEGLNTPGRIVLAPPPEPVPDSEEGSHTDEPRAASQGAASPGAANVTIPLTLTIALGAPEVHGSVSAPAGDARGRVAMRTVSAGVADDAERVDAGVRRSPSRPTADSTPRVVAESAPIIRLHSKEDYPPVRMHDWLGLAKLYWYEDGKRELAFSGSAAELFAKGPKGGGYGFKGRRIDELTRPWDSSRPAAARGGAGFALVTDVDPKKASSPSKGPVQVFFEHVEDRYVTYWLYFPWSTVPRKIPGRDFLDRLGFEEYDPSQEAELAEAGAALEEAYPGLVEAARPETSLEALSPKDVVRFVHAWFGPKWPVLHEGDWEGLAVQLGSGNRHVAFFQHGAPQIRELRENERPIVHVALGSHASYPDLDVGSEGSPRIKRFETLDEGEETEIELVDVRSQPWYGFGGAWGAVGEISDETGPLGPGEKKGPRPFAA